MILPSCVASLDFRLYNYIVYIDFFDTVITDVIKLQEGYWFFV